MLFVVEVVVLSVER